MIDHTRDQEAVPLRILLADDHPLFRFGLGALLAATPDMEVVGEATTGEDAARQAAELQPDVVLMDIQMPGLGGIAATRQILLASPHIRVLMVTMFADDASVFAAMRAGARGYVLKDAEKGEIVRAIRAVAEGEAIFSPAIAARVIAFLAAGAPATPAGAFPELTERERTILHLLGQGASNAAIAARLGLQTKTVANYVSTIFGKLQVADRAAAMVRVREAGLE
jgi:DNA-binding NarL/FixJ family response regulator